MEEEEAVSHRQMEAEEQQQLAVSAHTALQKEMEAAKGRFEEERRGLVKTRIQYTNDKH